MNSGQISGFGEFDAISPRVPDVEPFESCHCIVPLARNSRGFQTRKERLNIARCKGRVRLSSSTKILLDSDVQLTGADFEPAAPSGPQGFWLVDFWQSQEFAEECARFPFASLRSGYLHMIDFKFHSSRMLAIRPLFHSRTNTRA